MSEFVFIYSYNLHLFIKAPSRKHHEGVNAHLNLPFSDDGSSTHFWMAFWLNLEDHLLVIGASWREIFGIVDPLLEQWSLNKAAKIAKFGGSLHLNIEC